MATLTASATLDTTISVDCGHHIATPHGSTEHITDFRKAVAINRNTKAADKNIIDVEDAVFYNGTSSNWILTTDWLAPFRSDETDISLVCWIKPENTITSSTNMDIFGLYEGTLDQDGLQLAIKNGQLQFKVGQEGGEREIMSSSFIGVAGADFTCIMVNFRIGGSGINQSIHGIKYNIFANNNDMNPTVSPISSQGLVQTFGYPIIGGVGSGGQNFHGCIGPIWMDNTYIDFSQASNRQKFTTSEFLGKFRELGTNGELPTGSQPKIYIRGTASNNTQFGSLSPVGTGPNDTNVLTRNALTDCNMGITKVND